MRKLTETENKNINEGREKYRAICHMNGRIGYRNSERIWSMKVVRQSPGETLSMDVKTLPVLLMSYHVASKSGTRFG